MSSKSLELKQQDSKFSNSKVTRKLAIESKPKNQAKSKVYQIKFVLSELHFPIRDAQHYFIFPVAWIKRWSHYLTT